MTESATNKLSPTPEPGTVSQSVDYEAEVKKVYLKAEMGRSGAIYLDGACLPNDRIGDDWEDAYSYLGVPSPEPKVEPAKCSRCDRDYNKHYSRISLKHNEVLDFEEMHCYLQGDETYQEPTRFIAASVVVNPSPVKVGEPQTFEEWWNNLEPNYYRTSQVTARLAWNAARAAKSGTAVSDPKDTHGLTVKWHDNDQLFVARILEMGWCTGHGNSREEAIAMAESNMREALIDPELAKSGTGDGVGTIERMNQEGITQQDIHETMPPRQGEIR